MDGVYAAKIKTPMGQIQGKLILQVSGKSLSGRIEAMGMQSSFQGGTVNGNQCTFGGTIKTMFGNISYQATGEVRGSQIAVVAKTNMGDFQFEGTKE